jgi:hypothetical protein
MNYYCSYPILRVIAGVFLIRVTLLVHAGTYGTSIFHIILSPNNLQDFFFQKLMNHENGPSNFQLKSIDDNTGDIKMHGLVKNISTPHDPRS